nr:MAG TPA: hypothetical protein [Caudoviricetes sp.]DAY86658.1 MAG TPA: hypothetical protein [Caudoviricetes sp.]
MRILCLLRTGLCILFFICSQPYQLYALQISANSPCSSVNTGGIMVLSSEVFLSAP